MMAHLGGPESRERIAKRQAEYRSPAPGSTGSSIRTPARAPAGLATGIASGRAAEVFEIGWSVAPEFQGRGLARSGAALVIAIARAEREPRFMHAYPSVDNGPSNAICRRLGFRLDGAVDLEYPPGTPMRCNDWRLDLAAGRCRLIFVPRTKLDSVHKYC